MLKGNKSDVNRNRGGRLARRARSFKEDFLCRLNQMRSPSGGRAASPSKNIKNKAAVSDNQKDGGNVQHGKDVDSILHSVHLLSTDLRYFQDVVEKNILEMLPGSATVILETVFNIHSILKESLVNEQSSLMLSASNQVYQTLANLIRWSDNILLYGEKAVEKENVSEIAQSVHDAVKSLVQLSVDRLQYKDSKQATDLCQYSATSPTKPESPHRSSLPDIPLTPREREILEQTKISDIVPVLPHLRHSASSDSILGPGNHLTFVENLPPPKPPLPAFRERVAAESVSSDENPLYGCDFHLTAAPPLPPKKKLGCVTNVKYEQNRIFPETNCISLCGSYGSLSTELNSLHCADFTSPCSQSPDNLTPISKSSASSLDSNLNNSIDDLLSLGHSRSPQCSDSSYIGCTQQSFISSFASQSYCEMSSYTSTVTTTSTSVSFHSSDTFQDANGMFKTMNETDGDSCKFKSKLNENYSEPPALPIKMRTLRSHATSQYDNLSQFIISDIETDCESHTPQCPHATSPQNLHKSDHMPSCPHHQTLTEKDENGKPPPLPPKKRTIMAYMQMFGSYSQPSESEFLRHSLHTYKVVQASWQQIELSFMQQSTFNNYSSNLDDTLFDDGTINSKSIKNPEEFALVSVNPPTIPPKKNRMSSNLNQQHSVEVSKMPVITTPTENLNNHQIPLTSHSYGNADEKTETEEQGALDELDPSPYLTLKKNGEEGPDIRGGTVDSLIVQATKATKNDFLYQEAFLTTYRTFITPYDLICKLLYRYNKFIHMSDMRQRAARNSFALLVRVVDDLCLTDIRENVLKILMDFICQLVSRGDLLLARALRKKVVEKCHLKQRSDLNVPILLPSMAVTTHKASILDFKSENIAEQMTVLDADLFQKIEIPEVLLWAKEQKEELSPNLTTFTEHFNKMSYWARSRILEQEEAKDREKYVVKFIKVMKYLRKLNNFNSYLAILSALDSAPIRRLEWQRNITEGLKEYCALIDSSSSFRAYRQALAETGPPCIPYIGLILQDLTFVHIGNSDILTEDVVNFSKRWQQFNILDNMRRFKNCQYPVKRNEQIISFFNNFDDYLCEEAMWQISETIKPRGGKKKSSDQT